jgi:2-oxo-4-hydroxy-4-carboxy-5-ureidoimidazoline decarboxylase
MVEVPGLDGFNALSGERAEHLLRSCCSSRTWARKVSAGRPYGSVEELYLAADDALAALSESEVDEALAGHPRIGDRPANESSQQEQAGVAGADERTLAALAEANRVYEERFGHVYLVSATGRGSGELLTMLRDRLGNEPAEERRVVRSELGKINRIRLDRLLRQAERDH